MKKLKYCIITLLITSICIIGMILFNNIVLKEIFGILTCISGSAFIGYTINAIITWNK